MTTIQTASFIDDGYTKRGYIKPEPGLHDGLLFSYRPMLAEQAEDLEAILKRVQGAPVIRATCKAISEQLYEWSEVDSVKKPRPITEDSVRRLPRDLLTSLRHVIQGVWPGDPLPDPTLEEQSEYYKATLAAAEGKAPGIEQLEADRKN